MRSALVAAVLLAVGFACRREASVAQDAEAYAEILGHAGQDPESELSGCSALGEAEMRGDCASVVAVAAAKHGGDARSWCARVPTGRWRDECVFQTAEAALIAKGADRAAALCQQAGPYQADCVVHLWRPELGRVTDGMGAADFASRYPAAEQLYVQTAAQVGEGTALASMYWFSFFGTGFRNSGGVDLARCAGLPEGAGRRCEDAAALLLTEPLEGLLRGSGQRDAFCALSPPNSDAVANLLGVSPSAALDRALVAQQPMICGTGGTTLSAGLRTNPSLPNGDTRR